jgi:hypothetical protein
MNSDAFYTIGKTHKVCQDYALAGRSKSGKAFAIVSDGCSSSPHTDVGARLLVWAAREMLEKDISPDIKQIIRRAAALATLCSLPQTCLDATLLIAHEKSGFIKINMWGDGIIVFQNRQGEMSANWAEYDSGAPFYPSYGLDKKRLARYRQKYGDDKRNIYAFIDGAANLAEITHAEEHLACELYIDKGFVLIGSDGVMAFGEAETTETSKTINPVAPGKVAEKLAAIKGFRGEFVTRRCNRFFSKQCPQLSWEPQDDVAIGGIYSGDLK